MVQASPHAEQRFEFGANWRNLVKIISPGRIRQAEDSLRKMLDVNELEDRRFLDIGCGSGLFSLAARNIGAAVHSFDYDPLSVACSNEVKRRFRPDDVGWTIEQGSVLDANFMRELGTYDVVYSWGVLHHTGSLDCALELAGNACATGGTLFIAIYNDQGRTSRRWCAVKRQCNRLPQFARPLYTAMVMAPFELKWLMLNLLKGRPQDYLRNWTNYSSRSRRGMSRWIDMIDWVGGYPFEVAKPEQIIDFYHKRGFVLQRLTTCGGGYGCNEYVFRRGLGSSGGQESAVSDCGALQT
jgi:2-polyprenyl-6-hydroxyphenyl methylase/3-demethylubiquinone-9 3-methyltransferase